MCKCKHKHVRFFHTPFTSSLRTHEQTVTEQTASRPRRQAGGPPTLSVCLALNVLFELFEIWTNAHPEIPNHTLLVLPQSVQKKKREIQIQMKPLPLTSPVILSPFCPLTQTKKKEGEVGPWLTSGAQHAPPREGVSRPSLSGWTAGMDRRFKRARFPPLDVAINKWGFVFFFFFFFWIKKGSAPLNRTLSTQPFAVALLSFHAVSTLMSDDWWLSWSSLNCTVTKESSPPHHPPSHTWGIQISKFKNRSRSINWPQGTKVKS